MDTATGLPSREEQQMPRVSLGSPGSTHKTPRTDGKMNPRAAGSSNPNAMAAPFTPGSLIPGRLDGINLREKAGFHLDCSGRPPSPDHPHRPLMHDPAAGIPGRQAAWMDPPTIGQALSCPSALAIIYWMVASTSSGFRWVSMMLLNRGHASSLIDRFTPGGSSSRASQIAPKRGIQENKFPSIAATNSSAEYSPSLVLIAHLRERVPVDFYTIAHQTLSITRFDEMPGRK